MDYNEKNNIMEEDFQAQQEEIQKMNKSKQVYKDTITLIKLKMSKADTLIRQYNDKMKECDLLNEELVALKNDKEGVLKKYNFTMEKLTKIELSNTNYKDSLDTLKNLSENQKIKLDENEKHINQLLFKIREMEQKLVKFEEDNKTLEQEVKSAKTSVRVATKKSAQLKHQTSQTLIVKTQDTSINTEPQTAFLPKKLNKKEMKDKSVITDDISYDSKEPFPIYCSKCDNLIEPAPVHQILKIMSLNPPLLSECHSPPNSPNINTLRSQVDESHELVSFNIKKSNTNNFEPNMFIKNKHKNLVNFSNEKEHSSFMEIDSLNRKINNLENLMKKIKKNKRMNELNGCHQNCPCTKKNIKFIVQLPNQEEIFEYRKREKRKKQNLRHYKRKFNFVKRQNINDYKWSVENSLEFKKKRKLSNLDIQREKKLKRKKQLNKEKNDLFGSVEDCFSDEKLVGNYNCSAKNLSSPNHLALNDDSLSSNENLETNLDLTKQIIEEKNDNHLKSKIVSSIPQSSQTSVCNTEKEICDLSEINITISKICDKNELLLSDLDRDSRIENKKANEELVVNNKENLDMDLTFQLSNDMLVTNSLSLGENNTFFEHHKSIQNQNGLSTNSSLPSVARETEKQLSDSEEKSLLNEKSIYNNFICSIMLEDSQKLNTNISSDLENVNLFDKKISQVVNKESMKLKTIDLEKNIENPFYSESSTNSSTIITSLQNVSSCSSIADDCNLLIKSSNDESISDDCLSDSQVENDILSSEIETNNVTVSEELFVERDSSLPSTTSGITNRTSKKKSKITQKKKLLTIIRNIKKSSKRPIKMNKMQLFAPPAIEKPLIEVYENKSTLLHPSKEEPSILENITFELPIKKQRIAHTPKSILNIDESKTHNINEIYVSKDNIEKSTNKISAILEKQAEKSNDNISLLLEDYDKTCKERIEIEKNLKTLNSESLDFSLLSDDNKSIAREDVTKAKSKVYKNSECNLLTNDYSSRDLSQNLKSNKLEKSFILNNSCNSNTKGPYFSEIGDELDLNTKLINEEAKEEAVMKNNEKNPTIELRSRQVIVNKDTSTAKGKKLLRYQPYSKVAYVENIHLTNSIIVKTLNEFIANFNNTGNIKQKRVDAKENRSNEKFIEEQLELLLQAEWSTDVTLKIVGNLLDSLDIKTLAFFLIEFVAEKIVDDNEFDKSHTPPAPMMTRFEQKIIALIISINKINSEFTDIVIKGIRFKLFTLGKPQMVQVVERLFRMLVVLSKIKKDREKVRIFLCDALYCLNLRAINIIYVALTCWAEIIPKFSSNNDILLKTIIHIVMTLEVNNPFPKLSSLRKLLSTYYEYPNSGYKTDTLKEELLKKLQANVAGVNTAILLLCKKMGPTWSMENIIKGGLKHMIVTQTHPSLYEALTLLGNILRSSPKTDSNNNVGEIIDQLCDVLASNAGSDELQEGVLSCLLSIGKYKYEQIARFVIKWQSSEKDLRVTTKEKLNSFFKLQTAKWWWRFVNSNFPAT